MEDDCQEGQFGRYFQEDWIRIKCEQICGGVEEGIKPERNRLLY